MAGWVIEKDDVNDRDRVVRAMGESIAECYLWVTDPTMVDNSTYDGFVFGGWSDGGWRMDG